MITEDYVSFETAKLLKEKGFDLYKVREWVAKPQDKNTLERDLFPTLEDFIESEDFVELPITSYHYPLITLQMAMKWLREAHNLHCSVDYDYVLGWYCQITSLKETVEYDYEEMKHYHPDKDNGFSSSEEACESAIKYCLENLI